jgi:hypothetical protein
MNSKHGAAWLSILRRKVWIATSGLGIQFVCLLVEIIFFSYHFSQFDVAMSPAIASKAAAVYDAYKAYGGKVDHVKYVSDPAEAEKVRTTCIFVESNTQE